MTYQDVVRKTLISSGAEITTRRKEREKRPETGSRTSREHPSFLAIGGAAVRRGWACVTGGGRGKKRITRDCQGPGQRVAGGRSGVGRIARDQDNGMNRKGVGKARVEVAGVGRCRRIARDKTGAGSGGGGDKGWQGRERDWQGVGQ